MVVPVVNLLVNPEQAEVLSLASNETRIQLVLRNPLDTQTAKTPGSAMASLFGEPVRRRRRCLSPGRVIVPAVVKARRRTGEGGPFAAVSD